MRARAGEDKGVVDVSGSENPTHWGKHGELRITIELVLNAPNKNPEIFFVIKPHDFSTIKPKKPRCQTHRSLTRQKERSKPKGLDSNFGSFFHRRLAGGQERNHFGGVHYIESQ